MSYVFKKGDFVVYSKNGVCLVEDIKNMNFTGENSKYYILKPQSGNSSVVYVPIKKDSLVSKMRSVMCKKQIDELLSDKNIDALEWIEVKNKRLERFNAILSSGDMTLLLMLVRCIHSKKQEREELGKNISSTDENIFRTAQELIEEEFSFALGCSPDKVKEYIEKKGKFTYKENLES